MTSFIAEKLDASSNKHRHYLFHYLQVQILLALHFIFLIGRTNISGFSNNFFE